MPASQGVEVFVRSERVQAHSLPDRSLLLVDTAKGASIPLNESGGLIWTMCDGSHTVGQMAAAIAAEYDADPSQIDRDTRNFLNVLLGHGLIECQFRP
jgi:hypothetical protein